ncbi:MAG: ABC transporter ATP-binding protein [Chloroflexi bacterium]|nr:ABC transporter ATP-binding protein [Chloroflexota bacterium]
MISIETLQLTFPSSVRAIDRVSFEVPDGVMLTLLGPSGCGKTSTLRSIAGLEKPEGGEIRIGNEVVFSSARKVFVPPNKRRIGMVFQSYAIWPHMTVFDNVAYPLRTRRVPKAEVDQSTREVLDVVGLGHLARRPAPALSGGQQQRVALARALVARPEVLLLDEPLSNLDAKLREEMRLELKQLQRRFKITSVYVTHDQEEALALSDIIVVMNEGKVVEIGRPKELYQRPRSQFAADFLGLANHLRGKLSAESVCSPGLHRVDTDIGPVQSAACSGLAPGEDVFVSIRPEDVLTSKELPTGVANIFRAKVTNTAFLGHSQDCWVTVGEYRLRLRIHPHFAIEPGEEIYLAIPPEHCTIVRPSAVISDEALEPGKASMQDRPLARRQLSMEAGE